MSKRRGADRGSSGDMLLRFVTGQHLDGRSRSDATFLADGTQAEPHYWGRGNESRWALLAGWKRAAIRLAAVALVLGLLWYRQPTEWLLAVVLGPATGLLAVRGLRAWFTFEHYREKILPLHYALSPVLDIPPATRPRTWLTVPADYGRNPDAEIVIYPPDDFTASDQDKQTVTRTVTSKLGIEAPEASWLLDGRKPRIVLVRSVPPPAQVLAADIRSEIEAAAEHELILGIGKRDEVVKRSVDTETPHIGLCMGTGDGKSFTAMNIATQVLWHGGLVLFLDYKLMSHMWARGLPNVAYAGTPAEIHQALLWLASDDLETGRKSEITRRKEVALASADIRGNIHADLGPRIVVVAEELNATQKQLKRYWRSLGGKGPSPASEALDEVLFTGRQLRIHALQIAQRLSARASGSDGSADGRENIGTIVFSNPSASTWKMLCDGHAQPPASDHKGRYQVVSRKTVQEMQGALWVEEDARAFATAGRVALPRHDMPFVTPGGFVPAVPGAELARVEGPEQPIVVGHGSLVPAGPAGAVTLAEAVAAGLLGPTLGAARKASQRDPDHPAPVGQRGPAHLYDVGDLYAYRSQKVRVMR